MCCYQLPQKWLSHCVNNVSCLSHLSHFPFPVENRDGWENCLYDRLIGGLLRLCNLWFSVLQSSLRDLCVICHSFEVYSYYLDMAQLWVLSVKWQICDRKDLNKGTKNNPCVLCNILRRNLGEDSCALRLFPSLDTVTLPHCPLIAAGYISCVIYC